MNEEAVVELSVFSEIGPLESVLVHEPGPEVDVMPPSMMQELLFDDIIYGPRARDEHRRFRAILEKLGVAVLDMQQLLRETLEVTGDDLGGLVDEIASLESLEEATRRDLREMPPAILADALVHGLLLPHTTMRPDRLFRLSPLPNLLFSRDAQVVIGEELIISGMNRRARQREPLISRFVFQRHPALRTERILFDFAAQEGLGATGGRAPSFEGGDLLVFHEGVLLVGVSERTMEIAVNLLVDRLRRSQTFHTLIMVPMPRTRNAMHLDTIFTRISVEECLVYPPMVLPGNHETLSVISLDLSRPDDWGSRHPSLLDALRSAGVELQPVCCGHSSDYIRQCREQWTDGANSFTIAPGIIMTYSRNASTAGELASHGYEIVAAADMEFDARGPRMRCLHEFVEGRKYAILVCGEELSRARGGPRCMTMPLARAPVRPGGVSVAAGPSVLAAERP